MVLSRPPESLIGRTIGDALPGAEPLFLVSGDATQRRVTIRTQHGDRNLGFTNATVEVNGGHGAVAVFRELSEVEAARREQEERARREQLASSARSFAHEVRNPLAAIGAAAQVVARDDCEKSQRVRLARAIVSETDRVTGLVQEYVERRDVRGVTQEVDVTALLGEVVEINLLESPARARITVDAAAGLPLVRGDVGRLKQVVLNLVLNAVKATDAGGEIALEARPDAGGVALRVSDTGCGIAATDLPRIFDESFSTRQGGGLGLPIARRIVEQHGGAIRVESTEGKGSTFTVWLPAA
jgi:signal transduction histidine kinase